MTLRTKIKLKIFIFDLLFEIAMWSGIIASAILHDRIIETIFFYLCWLAFRFIFPKEYHYRHSKKPIYNILGCLLWTNIIFWIVIPNMFPLGTSIFASVVASLFVNTILYKFQDYLDLKKQVGNNTIDIYSLSEEELRNYAKSKGLGEMMIDTLVLKVIYNYKWTEIQSERNYSRSAIKYHKKRINQNLNINL